MADIDYISLYNQYVNNRIIFNNDIMIDYKKNELMNMFNILISIRGNSKITTNDISDKLILEFCKRMFINYDFILIGHDYHENNTPLYVFTCKMKNPDYYCKINFCLDKRKFIGKFNLIKAKSCTSNNLKIGN